MLETSIKKNLEDGDIITIMNKDFVEMVGVFVDNNPHSAQLLALRNVHFVKDKQNTKSTKNIEKVNSYIITPLYKTVDNSQEYINFNVMDGTFLKVEKSQEQSELKSLLSGGSDSYE